MNAVAYNKFQKMILNVLMRKMGPAANDFAVDLGKNVGIPFHEAAPGNVSRFAERIEIDATRFVSEKDAKFMANVIRKLK
jgi:hypothetical protein